MDPRKRLSGGYVCERELGRGGQGVVRLARDRTGRQVVVKFLLPGMEYDEVALARARSEFGAASRVGELATARVLDADLSGQHPYIVSEFVQGPTIQQHVAAGGPLPSGRLQSLGLAVAHALAQVHRVGVVHRDVKPSDILLSPDGPRIIDFGIARDDRSLQSVLTTPGSVLGSPAYMSPEQVKALPVTAVSDVFSLGGTLYFAATGRRPFAGEGDYEVLVAVCTRDADLTAAPEPVRSVIADCLRKHPAERPTAAQLVTRLAGATGATEATEAEAGEAEAGETGETGATGETEAGEAEAGKADGARTESRTPSHPPGPRSSGAGSGPSAEQLRSWGSRPAAPRWLCCSPSCSAPPREDRRRSTAHRPTARPLDPLDFLGLRVLRVLVVRENDEIRRLPTPFAHGRLDRLGRLVVQGPGPGEDHAQGRDHAGGSQARAGGVAAGALRAVLVRGAAEHPDGVVRR